jgi:hypothetical protein
MKTKFVQIFGILILMLAVTQLRAQQPQLSGLKVYPKTGVSGSNTVLIVEFSNTSWNDKAQVEIKMGTKESMANVLMERAIVNMENNILSLLLLNKKYTIQNNKVVLELEMKEEQRRLVKAVSVQVKTSAGQLSNVLTTELK